MHYDLVSGKGRPIHVSCYDLVDCNIVLLAALSFIVKNLESAVNMLRCYFTV